MTGGNFDDWPDLLPQMRERNHPRDAERREQVRELRPRMEVTTHSVTLDDGARLTWTVHGPQRIDHPIPRCRRCKLPLCGEQRRECSTCERAKA